MSELEALDRLIETLVSDTQIEYGLNPEWMQAHGFSVRAGRQAGRSRMPGWTAEEEAFYLENAGRLSLEEMAEQLGRSENAIKCHWFKRGLPSPSKQPGYLTARQAALLLGIDEHKTSAWMDRGLMPGEKIPGSRNIRRVGWIAFKMWMVRPSSWVYYDVEKIRNDALRRLVKLAQAKWGDEWWTSKQVADYHGLMTQDIKRFIRNGHLPAYRAVLLGGRAKDQHWAYWFIKKSDAVKFVVKRKSDPNATWERKQWSPRADAFILKSRVEGKRYEDIAQMMKWPKHMVEYRALYLADGDNWVKRMCKGARRYSKDG